MVQAPGCRVLLCPGTGQAQVVLAELPAPLRVVYRRIWQPRYARHDHWEPSTPA